MALFTFTEEEKEQINKKMSSVRSLEPKVSSWHACAIQVNYNDGKRPPRNVDGLHARNSAYESTILDSDLD